MKRFMSYPFVAAMMLFSSLSYANPESFFNVLESGAAASLDVTLCLHGKEASSCEDYHVNTQDLRISTKAMKYYPAIGIKVLTPGYKVSGCTPDANGYCLFSASNMLSTSIQVRSTSNN